MKRERKPALLPSSGFVVSHRETGTLSCQSASDPFVEDFGSLDIMGGHVFTDGSGGAETKDPRHHRCGFGVAWIISNGGLLQHAGRKSWHTAWQDSISGKSRAPRSSGSPSVVQEGHAASLHLDRLCVCRQRLCQRETEKNTCPTLTYEKNSGKLTTPLAPPVLFHKVWRSHATEAEIAAETHFTTGRIW